MFTAGATKDNNAASVIAVQMNHEKNFAFIEFSCHEDASAAMGFDGITLGGHALKIRRPKDYKPVPIVEEKPNAASGSQIPNIVSTNVEEGPNKIFIGGLPSYLTEEQVKELVSAFGQLRSFNLVKDTLSGNSKGFAFFEYTDADVTDRACQTLNGMKLGDKTVLAQRANLGAKHNIPNPSTESILNNPTSLNFLNLGMPIAAAAALLGINVNDAGAPTRVIQLMNIVSPNDIRTEDDLQEISEDIKQECVKYGTVVSMHIPRPPPLPRDEEPKPEVTWGVGRAFIEYKRTEDAQKALEELGGRKFGGHTVISGYFSEDKYAKKDFGPDFEEEMHCAEKFRQMQMEKERQRLQQEEEF
jgi:splicing factor U2AF subunit